MCTKTMAQEREIRLSMLLPLQQTPCDGEIESVQETFNSSRSALSTNRINFHSNTSEPSVAQHIAQAAKNAAWEVDKRERERRSRKRVEEVGRY